MWAFQGVWDVKGAGWIQDAWTWLWVTDERIKAFTYVRKAKRARATSVIKGKRKLLRTFSFTK